MVIKSLNISVVPGKMEPSHKKVVDDALNGRAITDGSIGCLLVAVFACSDLDTDGKSYKKNGQWKLCRFKKQWQAALAGHDDFSHEDKALILGARELTRTRNYSHGWGEKAMSQPHVGKLLDSWLDVKAESASVSTSSHDRKISPCFQPEVADWDKTLKLLRKGNEKVNIDDVFNQIENGKEENRDTLCPDWREILTEELKQRELRLSADGYTN